MKLKHYIYAALLLLVLTPVIYWFLPIDTTNYKASYTPTKAQLLVPEQPIQAGSPLCLEVTMTAAPLELAPDLVWSSSYGTTLFKLDYENSGNTCFYIPESYIQQAGTVAWKLVSEQQVVDQGTLTIQPSASLGEVATYLGPRSITANTRDYTMLVSVPTDQYDNLLPENTPVHLKTQYQGSIGSNPHLLKNGVAWQRIPAPLQRGRISTTATVRNQSGKERVVDVFPDLATPFTINTKRVHPYADGNEQLTIQTSQIKDAHNNIVDDGTLITFHIENDQQEFWQTTAATVNGYAFTKALHPDTPSQWRIKAVIEGVTTSPEIRLPFKSIVSDFAVTSHKREITIGPLISYLGQPIPDGIDVRLAIPNYDPIIAKTEDGFAHFTLPEAIYPAGNYVLQIHTLGITKTQHIILE